MFDYINPIISLVVPSQRNFILIFILMLNKKNMIHQLLDPRPRLRILLQTLIQKIPNLIRHLQIRRYLDLILNNFNQLLFSCNLERILPYSHLIHHDTDRPYIYFLVILFSFKDLRTYVERSSTKSSSQSVILMHTPSEIT